MKIVLDSNTLFLALISGKELYSDIFRVDVSAFEFDAGILAVLDIFKEFGAAHLC